ncbi:MAG: FIST N-terminal domain-containing protein [Polyangiaceae bacterium]
MDRIACSIFSDEPESLDAGRAVAQELVDKFGAGGVKAVLAYATMNHDQQAVLEGLRAGLGKDTLLLGCSVQGVVSNAELTEDGFALGVMGFGGPDINCAIAIEREVQEAPRDKGRRLAQALKRDLKSLPKAVIVYYDPLCGLDVESMLEGMRLELDCPIVGGAAGQPALGATQGNLPIF